MPCRKNRGGQVSFLEMDCWFAQLPRRGTALVGLSLDGFLLLLFLSMAGIDFPLHCTQDFYSLTPPNCFFEELQKWRCPDYYENNVHKMQLPFSSKLLGSTLTAEEKQERRQQQLRRLQELNARRREEKLQLDQERLERLLYVQASDVSGAGPWPCSARCF